MPVSDDAILSCVNIAKKHGAKRLTLFGSAAEHPATARDIDLICKGVTGWNFILMGAEMEEQSGVHVDTVAEEENSAFVRYNLERGKVLYEE